eukprot:GEMP01085422.1.p1 GENE.GEMP01085422.1~~GEMP01085422.1.p1  ORF type:complete len:186 (+),score=29.07 GEMP01085422.1:171-728(+)
MSNLGPENYANISTLKVPAKSVPPFSLPVVGNQLKMTSPNVSTVPQSQPLFLGVGLANEFKEGGLCRFVIPPALVNRPRLTGVTLPKRKSNADTTGASRKSVDSSRKSIGLNLQFDSLRSNDTNEPVLPYVGMMRQHSYEGFEAIGSPNSPKHATTGLTMPSAMDLLDTYARSRPTSPATQSTTP